MEPVPSSGTTVEEKGAEWTASGSRRSSLPTPISSPGSSSPPHSTSSIHPQPPPIPPSHSRRSSIPPPLPEWFVTNKDSPVVTVVPSIPPSPHPPSPHSIVLSSPPVRHPRHQSSGDVPFSVPKLSIATAPASPTASPASVPSGSASPSLSSPPERPPTRDVLDALRLLCSGRVFTSYYLPSQSAPPTAQDWYIFFDLDASSLAKPQRDEEKASPIHDQGGMLYWTPVAGSHPAKLKVAGQSIPLSAITSILLGKQTAPLLHPVLAALREDCCFSITCSIASSSSAALSCPFPLYCFASKSPIMLVSFLMALKRIMKANAISDEELNLRGIIRRGIKDGVLTPLTPSAAPSTSSTTAASTLQLPPPKPLADSRQRSDSASSTRHSRRLTASPAHVRSRSQNTSVLFRNLVDVPYPASNAPIRSLSPLPLDSMTGLSPKKNTVAFPSSAVVSSSAAAAAPIIAPPAVPSIPAEAPALSSLLSPGDPALQFTLLGRLGQGRSGVVYQALYKPLRTHVAIKIVDLHPDPASPSTAQLASEVAVLSSLESDYFVGYVGCWRKGPSIWLVQEFMVGGSLSDFMAISGHVLLELEISAVMQMALLGLRLFHQQRRIHRDVKAANLLLNAAGQAKLADCGTAIQLSSAASSAHTGCIGSPYWMAPEVLAADDDTSYNAKADIWSLGITALELAYGDPPRHSIPPFEVMGIIIKEDAPRLDRGKGQWSAEFEEFIVMALQKDVGRRASADDLLDSRFIQKMELEEAREVLTAMWRAWGDRIERYRQLEKEIEAKRKLELEAEEKRRLAAAQAGPADWNANDVEYSVSSRSVPTDSQHSRSMSPSSSSSGRKVEPPSPSLSSAMGGGGVNEGSGSGGARGGGKAKRSMSFSQSFSTYGEEKGDEDAADDDLEGPEEPEEQVTVIDYRRRKSPTKNKPPVPIFYSASPPSTSPFATVTALTPLVSPATSQLPVSPGLQPAALPKSNSMSFQSSSEEESSEGRRRDMQYTAELSSSTGLQRYVSTAGEEEDDGVEREEEDAEGEADEESFSRQLQYEGEENSERHDAEDADFFKVINYSS